MSAKSLKQAQTVKYDSDHIRQISSRGKFAGGRLLDDNPVTNIKLAGDGPLSTTNICKPNIDERYKQLCINQNLTIPKLTDGTSISRLHNVVEVSKSIFSGNHKEPLI